MKSTRLLPLLLLATTLFVTTSCGKDGSAGPTGATGADGAKGDKGDTGSSNVIYSDWIDVSFISNTRIANGRTTASAFAAVIPAPKITKEYLTSADIKVYVNQGDASIPIITALPYINNTDFISAYEYTGTIELHSNFDASTNADNTGAKYFQYRYVIIPGGTAARKSQDIDWNNYAAVKAALHLPN